MQEHKIKYDGCTYRCYLKSVKRQTTDDSGLPVETSYFRVYCRRADSKCKVAVHLPARVTAKVLPEYVPPKPKVLPEYVPPKPKVSIDVRKAGKLRTLADNMEAQIERKLHPSIAEQRTTQRRAGMVQRIREEGEGLKRIQTTLYAMAEAIDAGTLPPILANISTKADVDKLLSRVRLRKTYHQDTTISVSQRWWLRLPKKPEPADSYNLELYNERLVEWQKEMKAYLKMGLDTDAKLIKAMDAIESIGKTEYTPEQERVKIIQKMEMELIGRKIPGYFPTPTDIARQMVAEADIVPGMTVLEPSAGKGNIADIIKAEVPGARLEVIEWVQELRNILSAKGYKVVGDDFLKHQKQYDRIIMNPPFEKFQDIDHVQHAYGLLKPGGRLVSIMSVSPFFRSDKKTVAFREWFEAVKGISKELPAKAFYSSERPTGVNTMVVMIDKPTVSIKGLLDTVHL